MYFMHVQCVDTLYEQQEEEEEQDKGCGGTKGNKMAHVPHMHTSQPSHLLWEYSGNLAVMWTP